MAATNSGAVILAAGASQRMGTPKALLPWGGSTLLEHAIAQARAAGVNHVVVVLGPATQHLEHDARLADLITVRYNPEPESGRSASIRIGTEALPDVVEALVIQSVDQPCDADVLVRLFAGLGSAAADITVPTYAGRRGHPVCLSGRLLAELRHVTEEDEGLRSIVRRHAQLGRVLEVAVNSPSVVWNLNDPSAYAAARAAAERR